MNKSMLRSWVRVLLPILGLALLPDAGRAQFYGGAAGSGGAISGNGTVTLTRTPTVLRMYLMLTAKGKTAEEAMAGLKARREAALAQLEQFGADKKSIDLGAPSISEEDSQRRRQLEMMIRQRMQSRGKSAKVKLPQNVTVVSMLTAQWPLEGKDAEEMFLKVQKLQEQIKQAKLATGKETEKESAEDQEMAEEMGGDMPQMYTGEEQGDPNTPMFAYEARIMPAERAKALAEAFQKAKANAQQMAEAAGVKLGPLVMVQSMNNPMHSQYSYGGMYDSRIPNSLRNLINRQQAQLQQEGRENELKATGSDPSKVVFNFTAMASFQMAKEGEKAPESPAEKK